MLLRFLLLNLITGMQNGTVVPALDVATIVTAPLVSGVFLPLGDSGEQAKQRGCPMFLQELECSYTPDGSLHTATKE